MKQETISRLHTDFETYVHLENGVEFWYARDLQFLLGYSEWRNFEQVLKKAKISCETANVPILHHFVDVNKMISTGKGAERSIKDIKMTRYACYLVAQNGDPKKEEIAFAQSYFAVQTRKQEIVEERIKNLERIQARAELSNSERELSANIFERGVDNEGFGRIRSRGDAALFGGLSTAEMKERLSVPKNRPLADKLPTVTISAKNLATEITNYNVVNKDLTGEKRITIEHVQNNTEVRNLLVSRGIKPENLPAEEDVKKIERKVKADEKHMLDDVRGFCDEE